MEPRKIVLILGNGFDLDLGLKTSYKDFWESDFCPKNYPAPLIRHLNRKWSDHLEAVRWYDLENELLEYALHGDKSDVVNENERSYVLNHSDCQINNDLNFIGVRDDFFSLVEKGYIHLEDRFYKSAQIPYREDFSLSVLDRDKKAFQLIREGLCKFIKECDIPILNSNSLAYRVIFASELAEEAGHLISIYSFNYTHVRNNGRSVSRKLVHYIHGCCEEGKIIIGTGDRLEIPKEYSFLMKSFDPFYYPPALVEDLSLADEIIIFGHSIGENDRQYFKTFFKKQVSYEGAHRKSITIITRDDESEMDIKMALQRMTDGNLSSLFGQNDITILHTATLQNDYKKLYTFLLKYYGDENMVYNTIDRLLKNESA